MPLPSLIPREVIFGNPVYASPKLSPDGKYLAYLAPDRNNVLQIWLRTLNHNQQNDRTITAEQKRGIPLFLWTYDSQQIIYLQDSDGDENWHLCGVSILSSFTRDLSPFPGTQALIVGLSPELPKAILVSLNLKNHAERDVYRINLEDGRVELDTENFGNVISWTADSHLQVRAAIATDADGGTNLLVRKGVSHPWKQTHHWNPEELGSKVGFSKDGTTLYLLSNHQTNTLRLLSYNLETGQESIIAEDAEYDVDAILINPVSRIIQAVSFYKNKQEWQILDPNLAEDFNILAEDHPCEFNIISRDLIDLTLLVAYKIADGPIYYYIYDRRLKMRSLLFSSHPKLEGLLLAPMKSISYQARDGLIIHGYLTTPVGIPAKRLQTVLLVHGGPWARDRWGYNPEVQWLANRGYAVLQVNFRGSTGYGKAFLNAGNREWAGKMHSDLIDGVNWLVQEGTAEPTKIAIMGTSYGGYATLVGLTFTPNIFAAGIDIFGPSSLLTLLQTIPPYWLPLKAQFEYRVGKLEEEEFLRSRSPLYFIDRIKAPLLIGHGANDPRVKQSESEQIVVAMKQANKSVEYILYKDEGHGFTRPENRSHFYMQVEKFLAQYLGGRFESESDSLGVGG